MRHDDLKHEYTFLEQSCCADSFLKNHHIIPCGRFYQFEKFSCFEMQYANHQDLEYFINAH